MRLEICYDNAHRRRRLPGDLLERLQDLLCEVERGRVRRAQLSVVDLVRVVLARERLRTRYRRRQDRQAQH